MRARQRILLTQIDPRHPPIQSTRASWLPAFIHSHENGLTPLPGRECGAKMDAIVNRKRARMENRPVYTRAEPALEEPPRSRFRWTEKEDTLFHEAAKVLTVKFDRKELDAMDGLRMLNPGPNDMNTKTKPFSGNPLRVLRLNAPEEWNDIIMQ